MCCFRILSYVVTQLLYLYLIIPYPCLLPCCRRPLHPAPRNIAEDPNCQFIHTTVAITSTRLSFLLTSHSVTLGMFRRCSKSCIIIANSCAFRFHIEKCALCYDLTHSTPGFAADPNNCAQFYMCELIGDRWNASLMVCPNCTFWNQEILSCETVDPSCYKSVSIFTNTVTGTGAYYILPILLFTGQTSMGRLFWITKHDVIVTITVIIQCFDRMANIVLGTAEAGKETNTI